MKWSYQIARVFGIPIKVHLTFILLLAFVGLSQLQGGESATRSPGVLTILMVFLCVVLHELGHSLVAMHYGVKIRDIVLLPIGGVARMESMPEDPKQEIAIAVAGPSVSAALAILFLTLAIVSRQIDTLFEVPLMQGSWMLTLFTINMMLLLFNLIPAFPLDGGRVLRGALVWINSDWIQGTRFAVTIGQVFAIILFFVGVFFNWWLALIALFVYLGGEGEQRTVILRWELQRVPARDAMLTHVQTVTPEQTVGEVVSKFCHSAQSDFPVVDDDHIVGILTHASLVRAMHEQAFMTPVAEIMSEQFVTAEEWDSLGSLYKKITESGLSAIPILRNGQIVGLINLEQIGKYHMLCATSRSG